MAENPSNGANRPRYRTQDAKTLFRLADEAIEKAKEHEREATRLYKEAQRLNAIGSAVADGRPVEDVLSL